MNCEALINRFLLDYFDGALPFARRAEFKLHLAMCPACRKYLASYRKTVQLSRSSREMDEPPPPELVEAIMKVACKT